MRYLYIAAALESLHRSRRPKAHNACGGHGTTPAVLREHTRSRWRVRGVKAAAAERHSTAHRNGGQATRSPEAAAGR